MKEKEEGGITYDPLPIAVVFTTNDETPRTNG